MVEDQTAALTSEWAGLSKEAGTPTEAKLKLPAVQLYNLKTDVGETKNLEAKYPGIITMLTDEIKKNIKDGRSTLGPPQKNGVKIILKK